MKKYRPNLPPPKIRRPKLRPAQPCGKSTTAYLDRFIAPENPCILNFVKIVEAVYEI